MFKSKKAKEYSLAISAIVAIVAVVGLVLLFSSTKGAPAGGVAGRVTQDAVKLFDSGQVVAYDENFDGKADVAIVYGDDDGSGSYTPGDRSIELRVPR